jgi:hypothetical protein
MAATGEEQKEELFESIQPRMILSLGKYTQLPAESSGPRKMIDRTQ